MERKDKTRNNIFQEVQKLYHPLINILTRKRYISIRKTQINYHYYFSPKRNTRVVPHFSLSGIWLTEAGFQIGDHLIIKVKKECLIIEKDKKEPKSKLNNH